MEVCDAPVGETEPSVDDVFSFAEDRLSHGVDFAQRRGREREDEIDIVDHQIEHGADIGRAEAKRPLAKTFNVAWRDE